ncbi:MAG: AAA family ATPase [Planctomycetota bacterium]
MKPLPFDMTPLARSLSMAPVPRAQPRTTTNPELKAPAVEEPVKAESIEAKPMEVEETKAAEAPSTPAAATPTTPSVDRPTPESTPEEPKLSRKERRAAAKAQREAEKQEREAAKRAREEAKTANDGGPDEPEGPKAVAAATPQQPTTELRTASYPRHFKQHRGWTANLAQEQIHALATHILARHTEQNLRTLAVTSALAGEGKTTVTLALAEKLAKAGKRILIIDLDAHRATLSHECGLEDAAGALQSSDPRDPTNLDYHVYSSDRPGISVMPAGYHEANADGPPLISPVHIGVLVLNAIEDWDIVLLDCPPLLPVADTHVIGEVVDKALMVVRAGSTPREMIDQAIDEFGRDKFLGAVLNRARPQDIPYFREVYGYYRRYQTRR